MQFSSRLPLAGAVALLVSTTTALGQSTQSAARSFEEASERRGIGVTRVGGAPPVIDGRIDDGVWQTAAVATDFVQYTPASGQPATERTEARIAIDEDALYVAMRMYDAAPDSIATQLGRRDASGIFSDWAHVVVDSYNDRRTGFRFSVSPQGVQKDVLHYNDGNEDLGWDAVWEAATTIDAEGWTAEFRIPLSQLRFSANGSGSGVWGINFGREIARRDERAYWSPVLQGVQGFVSQAGELRELPELDTPRRLEVLPYSLGRVTRAPGEADDPYYQETDAFGTFGADIKFGVTSNLTLTATLNPDFGQVEADPSEVNLSAFESFFSERRPFFLEGADIFGFRLGYGDGDGANEQLFYSRRIGRAPQGDLPDEAEYADSPEAATILGAAKLSGKTASGWSIGVLDAVTAAESARYVDEAGVAGEAAVEPLTNYAVARVARDFRDGRSTFGAIVTSTHRRLDDDALDFLRTSAYSGGIDLRHRFGDGTYEFHTALLASHIRGSADAIDRVQRAAGHRFQRPDADHIDYDPDRTSLSGVGAMVNLSDNAGRVMWAVGGTMRSPGFEVNDLGYQRDADAIDQFVWVGLRSHQPGPLFRRWSVNFNQWTGWSFGGERYGTGGNVNGSVQFHNYWGAYAGINRNLEALSTAALRGGPAILRPGATNFWFGVDSDFRKPVGIGVNGSGNKADNGDLFFSIGPSLRFRSSSRLEVALYPRVSWNDNSWQYVTAEDIGDETHYVFASLDQTTASLTTRLSYTFTPNLSLQLYAQPFISAGAYTGFKEVSNPRAARFDDRFHLYGADEIRAATDADGGRSYAIDLDGDDATEFTIDDPDFNFKQLRSNLVLRWQYRPGSTLYLVWSQGRTDSESHGAFDLGRDTRRLFDASGTNTLMLKISYWLDL